MSLKRFVHQLHYQPTPVWLKWLLPLETAYGLAVETRKFLYRHNILKPAPAPVPVISIGNLTTGGTGKTPMTITIARGLISAGKTVVVLSRGYGAKKPQAYARAMDPEFGDEAYLLQEQLPEAVVIVGKDRASTLRKAVTDYHPDFVLLDDGFQTLNVERTINILLLDGEHLIGNGRLLPLGPLREPLSAIGRADLIMLTKCLHQDALKTVEGWVQRYKPGTQVLPVAFRPTGLLSLDGLRTENLELLKGRPVVAVSGIAQPERFEADLHSQGAALKQHFKFSDHHDYEEIDVAQILAVLRSLPEEAILVTTDKDRPKLLPHLPKEWQERAYVLKVQPALDGRWFYHEFLSQMPALAMYRKGAPAPTRL